MTEAVKVHGNEYLYDNVKFTSMKSKVRILCKYHGYFSQKPDSHLSGMGCFNCYGSKLSTKDDFVKKAISAHGNKYDYTLVKYFGNKIKVNIVCKHHGEFEQTPNSHLSGRGCKKCSTKSSKNELIWLDSQNISKEHRQVKFLLDGKLMFADGYSPCTKTVYEYLGDFWHGNLDIYNENDYNAILKKTYGQLNNEVFARKALFIKHGFSFVFIWESEFKRLKRDIVHPI